MTARSSTSEREDQVDALTLPRHPVLRLAAGAVALTLGLRLVGYLIVDLLTPSALTRWEDGVNRVAAERRTPTMDSLTWLGSHLADTITCIALLVVLMPVMRWWLGRWREWLVLGAAIVGELLIFLVVTFVVQRDRPDVPRLDTAPPTSSFPSGHTAAAVAIYGCLAFIVWRQLGNRTMAHILVAVCCAVPVIVGLSRIYRGMHHPTDVLLGAIGGGIWLLVVVSTLLPRGNVPAAGEARPDAARLPTGVSGA